MLYLEEGERAYSERPDYGCDGIPTLTRQADQQQRLCRASGGARQVQHQRAGGSEGIQWYLRCKIENASLFSSRP